MVVVQGILVGRINLLELDSSNRTLKLFDSLCIGTQYFGCSGITYGSDMRRALSERAMAQSIKHAIHTLHWTGAPVQR
jgi:hypothetical protein